MNIQLLLHWTMYLKNQWIDMVLKDKKLLAVEEQEIAIVIL